jgi:hypothetical protein
MMPYGLLHKVVELLAATPSREEIFVTLYPCSVTCDGFNFEFFSESFYWLKYSFLLPPL